MTEPTTQALVERLRTTPPNVLKEREAAAAIEAQAREIERLQKLVVWNQEQREIDLVVGNKERDALKAELAELKDDLIFVERWAVHHGTKAHMSAQEALNLESFTELLERQAAQAKQAENL